MRAGAVFERGASRVDVARKLGVSRQTASQRAAAYREGGLGALAGAGRAGRRPLLTDRQLADVERALDRGGRKVGFPAELWTLARVARVIETTTGVSYSTAQTCWILRQRLVSSRQ